MQFVTVTLFPFVPVAQSRFVDLRDFVVFHHFAQRIFFFFFFVFFSSSNATGNSTWIDFRFPLANRCRPSDLKSRINFHHVSRWWINSRSEDAFLFLITFGFCRFVHTGFFVRYKKEKRDVPGKIVRRKKGAKQSKIGR